MARRQWSAADVARFAGRVVAPDAQAGQLRVSGGSALGDEPLSLSITRRDGRSQRGVVVETRLDGRSLTDFYPHLLFPLLWREISRVRRPKFPYDLRIQREGRKLLLDGRARSFSVYSCGQWAMA